MALILARPRMVAMKPSGLVRQVNRRFKEFRASCGEVA